MLQIPIEQLKPLAHKVIAELNKDKEPIAEMKEIMGILDSIMNGKGTFKDQKAVLYFYDDFLGSIAKNVLQCIHFKDKQMVACTTELCMKMAKLFAKEILSDNEDLARVMRNVFDPEMLFYREFGVKYIEPPFLLVFAEEEKEWREGLKKGDRVDVVKKEMSNLFGWATGTVEDRTRDMITVSYDGESESSDKAFALNSKEISPYGAHTGGNDWRKSLKNDDKVDCLDTAGVWYNSTVIEVKNVVEDKENRNVTMVHIGYRTYDSNGAKKDAQGRKFFGWSASFDEWINVNSLRIQKLGTLARKGVFKCNKSEDEDDRKTIDDTADVILNSLHNKEVYATLRKDKSRSEILVNVLNTFGEAGGFENILTKLSCKEKTLSFELAYYYFDILGITWYIFHRRFAQQYIPRIQDAMIRYLLAAPDKEIRKVQKERFDNIRKDLENLLRRVYTVIERYNIQENFDINMYTIFLKSNYLQRRIQGLKGLNEICKNVRTYMTRSINQEFLANWLAKNLILEEIFGSRKHQQIIQRSGPILKFLYENKMLQNKDLEAIWEYAKDEQLKQDVFKLICEVGFPLHSPELDFFAKKISSCEPGEICEEALDVIYEPSRYPNRTVDQLLKFSNVLAEISFRKDFPLQISEKALGKYTEMIATLDFEPHKKRIMQNCIESIKKNDNSIMALKLIRKVVNQYVTTSIPGITNSKTAIIDVLLTEFSLLKIFLENFKTFFRIAHELMQKNEEEELRIDRYPHSENINERIDFLLYIINNSSTYHKFPIQYVYDLWAMLYENPVTPSDSQALFKFLKEIATDQTTYLRNFDPKEGQKFYEEKVTSLSQNYENMTMEAFACILQFFVLINEHEGSITVVYPRDQRFMSFGNYPNLLNVPYIFSKKEDNIIPEIRTRVHPEKLKGIEIFWKIVQESNNKDVMEKSRDFLNKIYTQLTGEIEGIASDVRSAFIETYLNKLEKIAESKGDFKGNMLGRMMRLMREMIEESEKQGTGGLKSHSALLKGDLISLTINNHLTTGKGIPKKLEVETYSNTTIWELKVEIGKYFDSSADCMRLAVGTMDLKDTDHGRTIGEFIQNKRGVIKAEKKPMDYIPKVPLLNKDKQLTEPAKKVFTEIFNKFAKNGKMDAEGAAGFIRSTTGELNIGPTDGRIIMLFNTFDTDKDGYLDIAGFQEFYRDSIVRSKEDTVWQNIQIHGFRNDLKRLNEVEEVKIDISTLPRYILSRNPKAFDLFFHIIDINPSSAEQAWDLISRLSTNEAIYNGLLSVSDIEGEIKWDKLIDTRSMYRLLYCLQIIESFLEEDLTLKKSPIDSKKKIWRRNFVERGGFEFLLKILINKESKGLIFDVKDKTMKLGKECLGFLCKTINTFIRAATYKLKEGLVTEVIKAQVAYKKHLTGTEEEEALVEKDYSAGIPTEISSSFQVPRRESEASLSLVDVKELFKQKPSNIFFIETLPGKQAEKNIEAIPELVCDLDKPQAEYLMKLTNLKEIFLQQIDIMATILRRSDVDYYDTIVIKSTLRLFCSCILSDESLFSIAKQYKKEGVSFDQIILLGLFCSRLPSVREEFMDTFFFMCYLLNRKPVEEAPLPYILSILLTNIPEKQSLEVRDCAEYFHLMCKLIDIHYKIYGKEVSVFDPKNLLILLVSMLRKHRSSEKRNSLIEDKLLIGIINTIRKVLTYEGSLKEEIAIKEGLLHELFFNCLFPGLSSLQGKNQEDKGVDAQKCKSKESRTAAYKLLAILCRGNIACQSFLVRGCLEPLCKFIKPHSGWSYIPSSESRSKLGYAGVVNLGCVCYMISMIQQFYMIPTFRYLLLGANDNRSPTSVFPGDIDENVLHQLQRIFAFLELTERQDYNPSKFCYAFKDLEGKPTNTTLQQDAQEFLNLAFDRLENLLKSTPQRYLLQSVFGGKTCSQIICKGGCGSVRRNYEDFYNLSVGVKGHKTLFESLNKYISGDTISDYYCDKCKKKVDVVKRTCLSELPNVLIIHLQRIIYNFDTFMNEKINSRLEFPKEISMEPYTVEGLESRERINSLSRSKDIDKEEEENSKMQVEHHKRSEKYYQYKLVGVVVHFGTADAGHYYSFINTNRGSIIYLSHLSRISK